MKISRRAFIKKTTAPLATSVFAAPALLAGGRPGSDQPPTATGRIMTVTGALPPEQMGFTLAHEHVFSTFGLDPAADPAYDYAAVTEAVLPRLQRVRTFGCRTLVDATAAYFGRDPLLLRQLSEASGLAIVTNTGYYGAANDRYVPPHAYTDTVDQLAGRWLREWTDGIAGTGIRPGFIKLGVDEGALSEIDRKLVRAAARAHRESGLTVAVHTGDNPQAAREQQAVLDEEGVAPSAWIWVHAHAVGDADALLSAAEAGAWISLDGIRLDRIPRILDVLHLFRERGFLDRVLLSHDGNTYPRKGAGEPRLYEALFTHFIPALQEKGFTPDELTRLTVDNPRRAFTIAVRATG